MTGSGMPQRWRQKHSWHKTIRYSGKQLPCIKRGRLRIVQHSWLRHFLDWRTLKTNNSKRCRCSMRLHYQSRGRVHARSFGTLVVIARRTTSIGKRICICLRLRKWQKFKWLGSWFEPRISTSLNSRVRRNRYHSLSHERSGHLW